MDWDLLESYVSTLFDMVNTGDINCWDAKAKYRAFTKDIKKSCEIVPIKENKVKAYYYSEKLRKFFDTEEECLGAEEEYEKARKEVEENGPKDLPKENDENGKEKIVSWLNKKLFKDYKIFELKTYRDCTDEYVTDFEAEFYLANPEEAIWMGQRFNVDRIVVEKSWHGMNSSYTVVDEDLVFKLATDQNEKFEYIEIPEEYMLEISEIFKFLEKTDPRFKGYSFSEDVRYYCEDHYGTEPEPKPNKK